ncbi:MAG: ABC transporter permease [Acidimicrobiia bacterium]|nr:ABC transporter permease [Acidimicrobiia bacterium]
MTRSSRIVIVFAVAATIAVVATNWAGNEITVAGLSGMLIAGLALGSIYAVSATGMVVVYSTTGVFNFAQGAIGMYWAFLYWELRVNRNWPAPLALLVVVGLLAPAFGVVIDRLLMRRLQNRPLALQLMVTVGLMLALMGIAAAQWRSDRGRGIQPFFGTGGFDIGPIVITYHRLITVLVAALIAVSLRVLLHRARIGVAMRAVVDDRSLAALNGARPGTVSAVAWALGSSLAAVAGILIAPESRLVVEVLTLVVVDAFAAAAVGRLRSLPFTFAGAILLGVGQQFISRYLRFEDGFVNMAQALPTILLFVVVLAMPQARIEARRIGTRTAHHPTRLTHPFEALVGMTALFIVVAAWSGSWSNVGVNRGVTAMVTAIIMLSIVPLTGWAGQVSFAPLAFAGVGAVTFMHVAGDTGAWWGLLVAAAVTAPVGALMALPAVRLQSLYLALASVAFARGFELLFFTQPAIIDPTISGRQFVDLDLFGWQVGGNSRSYLLVLTGLFGALVVGLVGLRRSRFGRRWVAMADSEAAAATLGISLVETKVAVFAVSAAIAGFGGALLGIQAGTVTPRDFGLLIGLPIVLLLVVGGVSLPAAALFGGVNTILFIIVKDTWDLSILQTLEVLGPGFMAIALVARPSGAVAEIGRAFAPLLPWRADARHAFAADRRARRLPEIGRLGLSEPFTPDAVVELDRRLGVIGDVTPVGGYVTPISGGATR